MVKHTCLEQALRIMKTAEVNTEFTALNELRIINERQPVLFEFFLRSGSDVQCVNRSFRMVL